VPVGWGEPVYDKLDADIAYNMMSINAVKGVEIGAGFCRRRPKGHRALGRDGSAGLSVQQCRRHLGGISTGQDIVVNVAVKPTSSIRLARRTIDKTGNATLIETHGRHDPCVGIRATPICEAMLALTLMDHALRHRAQNADVSCETPRIAALAPSPRVHPGRAPPRIRIPTRRDASASRPARQRHAGISLLAARRLLFLLFRLYRRVRAVFQPRI
jgi:chorismate synthase